MFTPCRRIAVAARPTAVAASCWRVSTSALAAVRRCSTEAKPADAAANRGDVATQQPLTSSSFATLDEATGDKSYGTVPPDQMTSTRAVRMMNRELLDEGVRPYRPIEPKVPRGWTLDHEVGTGEFWVTRAFENEVGTLEELRVRCAVERKDYEKTYRQDDGEREEPEHFNFSLFISKPKKGENVGGLEFSLTGVDGELVFDAMAIHSTRADLVVAMTRKKSCVVDRDLRYRGPYINELDEDFADELMNYLDDRGIHNAFSEYMTQQAYWVEQLEYENFLKLIRGFSATQRFKSAADAERAKSDPGREGEKPDPNQQMKTKVIQK